MLRGRREPKRGEIRLTRSGAVFALGPLEASFEWDAVREIHVFKEDLVTYDTICLAISADGQDELVVTEDDGAFRQFTSEMEQRLNLDKGWYERVMRPAFSKNLERIYARSLVVEEQS